ncbi:GNAT family N-acetyltransferase [Streptomyces griseomycini]|nr:GNAT family N-acetyltransferase [Streptomyces griseomycini]
MQGQHADPVARPRRTRRPGRHPVRLRHHRQPPALLMAHPFPDTTATDDTEESSDEGRHHDLLDHVGDWGPVPTPAGLFQLVPVRVERDLPLLSRWMNDPAVAAFWELSGPPAVTADHVRAQLTCDGRSVPCVGVLEGTPMSYWEIYRADLDPLARHYPVRPHDTGLHLLIGAGGDRGRGLGGTLLRAVADLALDRRPASARVIAEPDLRNIPSVTAFLRAGFRFSAEIDLPGKRAALMVRDRSLRHLL